MSFMTIKILIYVVGMLFPLFGLFSKRDNDITIICMGLGLALLIINPDKMIQSIINLRDPIHAVYICDSNGVLIKVKGDGYER